MPTQERALRAVYQELHLQRQHACLCAAVLCREIGLVRYLEENTVDDGLEECCNESNDPGDGLPPQFKSRCSILENKNGK